MEQDERLQALADYVIHSIGINADHFKEPEPQNQDTIWIDGYLYYTASMENGSDRHLDIQLDVVAFNMYRQLARHIRYSTDNTGYIKLAPIIPVVPTEYVSVRGHSNGVDMQVVKGYDMRSKRTYLNFTIGINK